MTSGELSIAYLHTIAAFISILLHLPVLLFVVQLLYFHVWLFKNEMRTVDFAVALESKELEENKWLKSMKKLNAANCLICCLFCFYKKTRRNTITIY